MEAAKVLQNPCPPLLMDLNFLVEESIYDAHWAWEFQNLEIRGMRSQFSPLLKMFEVFYQHYHQYEIKWLVCNKKWRHGVMRWWMSILVILFFGLSFVAQYTIQISVTSTKGNK